MVLCRLRTQQQLGQDLPFSKLAREMPGFFRAWEQAHTQHGAGVKASWCLGGDVAAASSTAGPRAGGGEVAGVGGTDAGGPWWGGGLKSSCFPFLLLELALYPKECW